MLLVKAITVLSWHSKTLGHRWHKSSRCVQMILRHSGRHSGGMWKINPGRVLMTRSTSGSTSTNTSWRQKLCNWKWTGCPKRSNSMKMESKLSIPTVGIKLLSIQVLTEVPDTRHVQSGSKWSKNTWLPTTRLKTRSAVSKLRTTTRWPQSAQTRTSKATRAI